jgi:threonine dehydrogenase-like Zn-dependent dehydrogenase
MWNVVPAPDELSFEEIAMTEPCAVALHSWEKADFKAEKLPKNAVFVKIVILDRKNLEGFR